MRHSALPCVLPILLPRGQSLSPYNGKGDGRGSCDQLHLLDHLLMCILRSLWFACAFSALKSYLSYVYKLDIEMTSCTRLYVDAIVRETMSYIVLYVYNIDLEMTS